MSGRTTRRTPRSCSPRPEQRRSARVWAGRLRWRLGLERGPRGRSDGIGPVSRGRQRWRWLRRRGRRGGRGRCRERRARGWLIKRHEPQIHGVADIAPSCDEGVRVAAGGRPHPALETVVRHPSATLAAVRAERDRPGRFVTIEGPEGAGKTSQAEALRRRAEAAGIDVVVTREPGGTEVGERVRGILLDPRAAHGPTTDALLFNAARAQLVAEVVRPALARGALVISTRFADSTLAYQGYGSGLGLDELSALERFATGGLSPDLTLLLDLAPAVGLARKGAEVTRFESAFDLAFHDRVRAGFLALAAADPGRFVVIDATAAPSVVADAIALEIARLPGLEALAVRAGDAAAVDR